MVEQRNGTVASGKSYRNSIDGKRVTALISLYKKRLRCVRAPACARALLVLDIATYKEIRWFTALSR